MGFDPVNWIRRAAAALPGAALPAVAAALVLLGTTALVQWETGAAEMGFGARLLLHGWIFAAIAAVITLGRRLQERTANESLAWTAAMALLCVLGWAGSALAG